MNDATGQFKGVMNDTSKYLPGTDLSCIPDELKTLRQWVIAKGGKANSPINPATKKNALVNLPETWVSFDKACEALCDEFPFLGFVLTKSDPYVGIDLDCGEGPAKEPLHLCFDPETGDLTEAALERVNRIDSYTEISPRGRGIHILAKGAGSKAHKVAGLEIYYSGRYFRMTGAHYPGTPLEINERTIQVRSLYPFAAGSNGEDRNPLYDPPDTLDDTGDGAPILEGERNGRLVSIAGALRRQGNGRVLIEKLLLHINAARCTPPSPVDEVIEIAKWAAKLSPDELATRSLASFMDEHFKRKESKEKALEKKKKDGWIVGPYGNLKSCQSNAKKLLLESSGWIIQKDTFNSKIFINGKECDDDELLAVGDWLETKRHSGFQPIPWARDHVSQAVALIAKANEFDSLADYLNKCAAQWDKTERINDLLTDVFDLEKTEYHQKAMRSWMIQGAARGLTTEGEAPKCDAVLLLIGCQGLGKSMFFYMLCPDSTWFCDGLYALDNVETIKLLQGRWIIELAELASVRKSEVEATRAFLSRRTDMFRPSYGRCTVTRPRRCIFGATTNSHAPLKDSEGNRRFLPIRVNTIGNLDIIAQNRDQLWGEAVTAYRAGELWHIPEGSLPELEEAREDAREKDALEDTLMDLRRRGLVGDKTTVLQCMAELKEERWGYELHRKADQMAIATALKQIGYKNRRSSEARWWEWAGGAEIVSLVSMTTSKRRFP